MGRCASEFTIERPIERLKTTNGILVNFEKLII